MLESHSPQAPSEIVGEFALASVAEVQAAIERARAAQREWWALGAAGRSAALAGAARALRERREEAIELIVRRSANRSREAGGEINRSIATLEYYAQACYAAVGSQYPPSLGRSPVL